MNKTGIVIILLCFLAAAAVVLWERRKTRKTMEEIERMLDAAMTGSFSETSFDESQLSDPAFTIIMKPKAISLFLHTFQTVFITDFPLAVTSSTAVSTAPESPPCSCC